MSEILLLAHAGADVSEEINELLALVFVVLGGTSIIAISLVRLFLFLKRKKGQPLVRYVEENIRSGLSRQAIEERLFETGWSREEVAGAFDIVTASLEKDILSPLRLEILRFGAVLIFFAHSLIAFMNPEEFGVLLGGSFITRPIVADIPFSIPFVGINDLLIALFLSTGKFPRFVGGWSALWIIGVVIVILTQEAGITSLTVADVLAHAAPLAIALTFAFTH